MQNICTGKKIAYSTKDAGKPGFKHAEKWCWNIIDKWLQIKICYPETNSVQNLEYILTYRQDKDLFNKTHIAQEIRPTINKWNLMKLKASIQ